MNETPDSSPKVLLVEDDACVAFLYRNLLQKEGYLVRACSDGEAALLALSQERFDAVVLDLMMPKVDGIEVLKQMRARSENRLTPVIVITAAKLKMVEEEARRYRARLYLDKTQHDQLLAGLGEIMAERAAMNNNKLRMAPAEPLADPLCRQLRVAPPPAPVVESTDPPKGLARLFRRKDE